MDTLLKARAIENQSYVIGVNRIGRDGNGLYYKGESQLINAKGQVQKKLEAQDKIEIISISKQELQDFRMQFPVLKDRDNFKIID